MRKICRFVMTGQTIERASQLPLPPGTRLDRVFFFSTTTDIVLLSIEKNSLYVWAEVDTDREETCEHNLLFVSHGENAPDMDDWRYWCTNTVGALNQVAHVYILRNAPYSLPA